MFVWDDARFFLAIHRTRTLSAAARQLSVNQSTVSRRLAELEARLGAKLFVRAPSGYVVSPSGERLIERAERMEAEAVAIEREVLGEAGVVSGTVRVTASDPFGAVVIVPALAELRAENPNLDFELVLDERIVNLTKREADMAVRVGRPAESLVVARRVCDFGYGLYASRAYLADRGRPRAPDDLGGHDVIFYGESQQTTPDARWLSARSRGARVALRTRSTLAHFHAARAGLGLAVLPCYLADPEPDLVRAVSGVLLARALWVVVHPDLRHVARIRTAADFVASAVAKRAALVRGAPKNVKVPLVP